MRRKRPNHLPGFKAKVALAAIKADRTLAELALNISRSSAYRQTAGVNAGGH